MTITHTTSKGNVSMGNTKIAIMVTLSLGASVASADKLSDFKDAVANRGCESIPYSDHGSPKLTRRYVNGSVWARRS